MKITLTYFVSTPKKNVQKLKTEHSSAWSSSSKDFAPTTATEPITSPKRRRNRSTTSFKNEDLQIFPKGQRNQQNHEPSISTTMNSEVHTPQTPNSLSTDHSIQNSTFAKNNQKTEIKNINPQFSYHFQGKTKKQKSENQNSPPITTISPSTHTNSPQHTPDEIFVSTINQIFSLDISSFLNKGNKLLFRFEYTPEVAQHNALILDAFDFNLNAAILAQKNSQAFYGSEFRNPDLLSRIFKNHPLWKYMNEILNHGASYPLEPIPREIREEDLEFHKHRGNHKSATKFSNAITSIIKEDVERGFALILPIQTLKRIKNISLAPLGCIKQNTIGNDGSGTIILFRAHQELQ